MKRLVLISSLLVSTIGCDQAVKLMVRAHQLPVGTFLQGTLVLSHEENPGAFLSFGESFGQSIRYGLFTVGVGIFLTLALFSVIRNPKMSRTMTAGWTFLIAGGIGNLIDRVAKSTVTDFLNVGIGPVRTGVFNIADMAIMLGIAMLIVPEKFWRKLPATKLQE